MNKKFLSAILFGALMVTSTGTFVSCKDYDDDIDALNTRVDGVESQIKDLEAKINAAKWITNVAPATGGFTVTFSDGSSYTITNGKDGENGKDGAAGAAGTEWTISEDGFWVCNGEKTTVKAVGQDGAKGETGENGKDAQPEVKKENGKWYLWNGTEFEEFVSAATPATNIPYYYVDPSDPNYTVLVICDKDGKNEKEIRLPMAADLGQIVLLGNDLDINFHRFNGLHKNVSSAIKEATWDGAKAMPAKGEYMLTANQNAVYVQVVPSNYDISKLNFKLVNTKGEEAPVVFGTPAPTTDAVSRAVSESGVYAIPYTLKDMTAAEMKAYKDNIEGKVLSLVANESVRSTYTYGVDLNKAGNNAASYDDVVVDVESLGEPVTVAPTTATAGNVYDSYLVMKDATAKADSVRYGISIDGMTISYSKDIKKGAAITFTVRQVTANAMVDATKSVKVTFGEAAAPAITEFILDEQPHNAVATYTDASGNTVKNQYLIADFASYFASVAPTEGDRLVWTADMDEVKKASVKIIWDEVNEYGESIVEGGINVTAQLLAGVTLLDKDNKSKDVTMANFSKVKIQLNETYDGITLGNGTLKAVVSMKNKGGDVLQTVELPFTVAKPTAAEIAKQVAWDSKYYSNNVLKVVDVNAIALKSFFKGNGILDATVAKPASDNDKITITNGTVKLTSDGKNNTVYTIKDLKVKFLSRDWSYVGKIKPDGTVSGAIIKDRIYGIDNLKVNFATTKGDDIVIGNVAVMCAGKSVLVKQAGIAGTGDVTYKLTDFAGDAYTIQSSTTASITDATSASLIEKVDMESYTQGSGATAKTGYGLRITTKSDKISVDATEKIKVTFTDVENSEGQTVNVTVEFSVTVKSAS